MILLIDNYDSFVFNVKQYVENNRKEIIEKATKRACKKKNKMVKYDEELIKAYSRIKK